MPKLCSNAPSQNDQPIGLTVHDRDRGDDLAAKVDLKLARYPAEVREQIADLLKVLATKPRLTKTEVR
jgi:hypothetical protein